jgi:hypothetical protein
MILGNNEERGACFASQESGQKMNRGYLLSSSEDTAAMSNIDELSNVNLNPCIMCPTVVIQPVFMMRSKKKTCIAM